MAGRNEVEKRELARSLLLARCELDRRELSGSLHSVRNQFHQRMRNVGRATPWILIGIPVGTLLLGRVFKIRKIAGLLLIARVASQLRPLWPFLSGFLRGSHHR